MGDGKVKESTAGVYATVEEVNSVLHSLEDMLVTRFEAIDDKFGDLQKNLAEMDARNEARFAAIDTRFAAIDTRFEAIDDKFGDLQKNLAEMDARNEVRFAAIDTRFEAIDDRFEAI